MVEVGERLEANLPFTKDGSRKNEQEKHYTNMEENKTFPQIASHQPSAAIS